MYQIPTWTCSETFSNFDATIQTFVLLAKADSIVFPLNITFWLTVAYCLHSFLLLAIGNKPLSLRSCHEAQNTFFVIQVFHIFILFSSSEKKRKDYYRYLRQWVIETFIITQPYKLCTKREAKVEIALPSNLFLVHLATLPFKRPLKQPDKLIICSAMF